jgi:hypothetical protein
VLKASKYETGLEKRSHRRLYKTGLIEAGCTHQGNEVFSPRLLIVIPFRVFRHSEVKQYMFMYGSSFFVRKMKSAKRKLGWIFFSFPEMENEFEESADLWVRSFFSII